MTRASLAFASLALGMAALLEPTVAGAQQRTPQASQVSPSYRAPNYAPRLVDPLGTLGPERARRLQSEAVAEYQKRLAFDQSPTRVRLAGQMSYLIEHGDCAGAAHLAWYGHDSSLASIVPAACEEHRRRNQG